MERTRNVQLSHVNSGNQKDALQGLIPSASDWHAKLTVTGDYQKYKVTIFMVSISFFDV